MQGKSWSKIEEVSGTITWTVVWDVWRPALSTQSLHLVLNGDGVGFELPLRSFSNKFLKTTNRNPLTLGWLIKASWFVQVATKYHLHATLTSTLTISMYLNYKTATKNRLRLFDLDSSWFFVIKDSINFDKTDIARNLTLSFTQTIATNKVKIAPYLPTILHWSGARKTNQDSLC